MEHGFTVVGIYPCGEEVEKTFNTLVDAQSFAGNLIENGGLDVIWSLTSEVVSNKSFKVSRMFIELLIHSSPFPG